VIASPSAAFTAALRQSHVSTVRVTLATGTGGGVLDVLDGTLTIDRHSEVQRTATIKAANVPMPGTTTPLLGDMLTTGGCWVTIEWGIGAIGGLVEYVQVAVLQVNGFRVNRLNTAGGGTVDIDAADVMQRAMEHDIVPTKDFRADEQFEVGGPWFCTWRMALQELAADAGLTIGDVTSTNLDLVDKGAAVFSGSRSAAMRECADKAEALYYIDPTTNHLQIIPNTAPAGTAYMLTTGTTGNLLALSVGRNRDGAFNQVAASYTGKQNNNNTALPPEQRYDEISHICIVRETTGWRAWGATWGRRTKSIDLGRIGGGYDAGAAPGIYFGDLAALAQDMAEAELAKGNREMVKLTAEAVHDPLLTPYDLMWATGFHGTTTYDFYPIRITLPFLSGTMTIEADTWSSE